MTYIATLHPHPPYDFALFLNFLNRFAMPLQDIAHENAYYRVIQSGTDLALVRVTGAGSVDDPVLNVELLAEQGEINHAAVIKILSRILAIESDERAHFFQQSQQDELLWNVVAPVYGLPATRTATVFEALMSVIIEQQIAWNAAVAGQRWLLEWGGNVLTFEGQTLYAFPTPEQIASASIEILKPLKITFKRMALLIDIANQVANGSLNLEMLEDLPAHEAYQELLKIKGVGHWTAAVVCSRALGHWHSVPHNDVALQAAMNRYFFHTPGKAAPEVVDQTLNRYGEFAGLAGHYTLIRWVLDQYPPRLIP